MSKIHDISFQIQAQINNSFIKAFGSAKDKLTLMQNQLGNLSKQNKLIEEFKKVEATTIKLGTDAYHAKAGIHELTQEIGRIGTPTRQMALALAQAQKASDKLAKAHAYESERLVSYRQKIKDAGLDINALAEKQNKLSASTEKLQGKMAKTQVRGMISERLQQESQKRFFLAADIMIAKKSFSFLQQPIADAIKFESVMADIRKLVHFDTPQEFAEMGNQIKDLSTRVPMAVEGLGHITAAAAQAGIAKKDLIAFTENAAQMAVAYNISAETAGDMMAKWRAGFHLNQQQVVALADQINILSDNSAASGAQIGEVVTRIGALGKIAGLTEAQVAALAATSIGAGVAPEIAATGIKKMMTTLTGSTAMTKNQATAFDKLGINVVKLGKNMQKNGMESLVDVLQRIKKLAPEQQAPILKQIFGEESIAPIAGLMNNLPEVIGNIQLVGDKSKYSGSMLREFASRSATTENSLQLFKNNLAAIAITIGSTFLPAINDVIKDVNTLLNQTIRPYIEAHKEAFLVIGKATLALAGLSVAFTTARIAISVFNTVMLLSSGLFGGFAKILLWFIPLQTRAAMATKLMAYWQGIVNAVMNANPVVRIVTGIIALGAAIYWVCTHWDTFIGWLKKAWSMLSGFYDLVMKVVGAVKSLFDDNDGKSFKVDINHEISQPKNFAGNLEAATTQQQKQMSSLKAPQNISYSPVQTFNITGNADKGVIQDALNEHQSNFTKMYDPRLAY